MDKRAIIKLAEVDRRDLVGREIKIKCDQFADKILDSKVVGISGDNLIIDRSGSSGLVNELINNQKIAAYLDYKGQQVVFYSQVSSPHRGRLHIPLPQNIFPETNRAFKRISLMKDIRLAYFNNSHISSTRLNKLKWIETKTANIGGGGVLVQVPSDLTEEFYMIIHLGFENLSIPKLLLGNVRHSQHDPGNQFFVGVEFIINENYKFKLPHTLIRNLPVQLFEFNDPAREKLARFVIENKKS